MVALVQGEEAEEVGSGSRGGEGAAAVPVDGGGVVREGGGRNVATIKLRGLGMSWWAMAPASSRSELEMAPRGFVAETN